MLAGDGETQPGPALARRVGLVEPVEEMRQVVYRHTWAVVGHSDVEGTRFDEKP